MIIVKFTKLHPEAVMPQKQTEGAAGFDLVATEVEQAGTRLICKFGLVIEIPVGYMGLLMPRSSIARRDLSLANSVGLIDSDYRGELKAIFRGFTVLPYKPGERCAQLVIIPNPEVSFQLVEQNTELSRTARNSSGFGSTGE